MSLGHVLNFTVFIVYEPAVFTSNLRRCVSSPSPRSTRVDSVTGRPSSGADQDQDGVPPGTRTAQWREGFRSLRRKHYIPITGLGPRGVTHGAPTEPTVDTSEAEEETPDRDPSRDLTRLHSSCRGCTGYPCDFGSGNGVHPVVPRVSVRTRGTPQFGGETDEEGDRPMRREWECVQWAPVREFSKTESGLFHRVRTLGS